jgi:hypothetical protein
MGHIRTIRDHPHSDKVMKDIQHSLSISIVAVEVEPRIGSDINAALTQEREGLSPLLLLPFGTSG